MRTRTATFLGRRLVETPSRATRACSTPWSGHARRRAARRHQIANELSLGDKVQREALGIWRSQLSSRLAPRGPSGVRVAPRSELRARPGAVERHARRPAAPQLQRPGDRARAGALARPGAQPGRAPSSCPTAMRCAGSLAIDHMGLLEGRVAAGYSLARPTRVPRLHHPRPLRARLGRTLARPIAGSHVLAARSHRPPGARPSGS